MDFRSKIDEKTRYVYGANTFFIKRENESMSCSVRLIDNLMSIYNEEVRAEEKAFREIWLDTLAEAECPYCHKIFKKLRCNQRTCGSRECTKANERDKSRDNYRKYGHTPYEVRKRTKDEKLVEKNKKARELGLTYGQLQALETKEKYARVEL